MSRILKNKAVIFIIGIIIGLLIFYLINIHKTYLSCNNTENFTKNNKQNQIVLSQSSQLKPRNKIFKNILWTGCSGFIAKYTIPKLLNNGHHIWGTDNFWKYGKTSKLYNKYPNFHFIEMDAKDTEKLKEIIINNKINIFVSGAAINASISIHHELGHFILRENELVNNAAFDACIYAKNNTNYFEKIVVISSNTLSMVYKSTNIWPNKEYDVQKIYHPLNTCRFNKLSFEYLIQNKLPYTIIKLFNVTGIGEKRIKSENEFYSGDIKLSMNSVVPNIIQKILNGQYPIRIPNDINQLRNYTYVGDIPNAINECIINPKALNNIFDISSSKSYSILEVSKFIWNKINPNIEFKYESDYPFIQDDQISIPNVSKTKEILGIECNTPLEVVLDDMIPYIKKQIDNGEL